MAQLAMAHLARPFKVEDFLNLQSSGWVAVEDTEMESLHRYPHCFSWWALGNL